MSLLPYWHELEQRNRLWDINRQFGFRRDEWDPFFKNMVPWRDLSPALRDVGSNVTCDNNKFQISVDVQHFSPEEVTVKTTSDGYVVIEGKHEEKRDQHGYVSRHFSRRYKLPETCFAETVQSSLSSDGVLTVTAPLRIPLPNEGERIVPITQTGPVYSKLASQSQTAAVEHTNK